MIGVVVLAHNEETQILKVIETMPDYVDKIIIIDDASTDKTGAVIEAVTVNADIVMLKKHKRI